MLETHGFTFQAHPVAVEDFRKSVEEHGVILCLRQPVYIGCRKWYVTGGEFRLSLRVTYVSTILRSPASDYKLPLTHPLNHP